MKLAWTEERIDVVASLLREGLSAREIGKVMGRSNGSIVGIVHRNEKLKGIGFMRPPPRMGKDNGSRPNTERDRIEARLHNRDCGVPIIGRAIVRKERTLMELTSAQCRFPILEDAVDGHLFCAETREDDSSYCAIHRKLCRAQQRTFQPREKSLDSKEQNQ